MSTSKANSRILVLDDTKLMRSVIVSTLKQVGFHQIKEAASAEQALPLINNWESTNTAQSGMVQLPDTDQEENLPWLGPDLIFLDINLDGQSAQRQQNGLELLKEIRSEYPTTDSHPFVVIVSADNSEQTITHAVKLGANGYLVKPFSSNNITQVLKKFLET